MNIAIITIYKAFNFGSFLQAYAMQEVLEKMGHKVTFLDCSMLSEYLKFRSLISIRTPLFSIRRLFKYRKDWKKLNCSRNIYQHFDLAIVGSDEVWNLNGGFEHWPQYLGENINADRIIAYAPSIGFMNPEELISNICFREALRRFSAICPRDNITHDLCRQISNYVTECVVDPTLLMLGKWESIIPDSKKREDYLVYYSYLDDTPMKEYILRFARKRNLKIIIVGFNYLWGDTVEICSPLEFISLLKNAKYVFTSTFHGSVFSTILKKKVIVRPSGQKVVDYLTFIDLKDHIFHDGITYDEFEYMTTKEINYANIYKILNKGKKESITILKNALET